MSTNRLFRRATAAVLAIGLLGVTWALPNSPASAADDGTIDLLVVSAGDSPAKAPFRDTAVSAGDTVAKFEWQINADSIGDVTFDPTKCFPTTAQDSITPFAGTNGFPANCTWPSIRAIDGHSDIIASGNQANASDLRLPNGKYLVSVTSHGFKIDGAHFTVAGVDNVPVTVQMNPLPVPTATVRVNVFNDNASTNGQFDGDPETITDMSGFVAQLNDIGGLVAFDVYGNPLCTKYEMDGLQMVFDEDGSPVPAPSSTGGASGGGLAGSESECISGPDGQIVIPNMGPNRYAVTVSPPDPQTNDENRWIQTTTLEGGHDWDTWNMEAATGLDTELVVGGEATPFVHFGFVKQQNSLPATATGSIKGQLMVGRTYVAETTGLPNPGNIWGGGTGTTLERPVQDGWVSIACLSGCPSLATDTAVYVQPASKDGTFNIQHVPAGTYSVTLWDEAQERLLDTVQVTVANSAVDVGVFPLAGWFTDLEGSIFLDRNGNGKRDGVGTANEEPGIPNFPLTLRTRVNTLNDQGAASALTSSDGDWSMAAYPLGQFLILEAYHQAYKTTGITWKLGNENSSQTQITDQVDWNVLNIFGLGAHIDIGVKPYAATDNGGIVGTVSYDTTRNELNPRNAVAEDWQPGVPDMTMQLWTPKSDGHGGYLKVASGPNAGAIVQVCAGGTDRPTDDYGTAVGKDDPCQPLDNTPTEHWSRPTGCIARTANGTPAFTEAFINDGTGPCLEAPMTGVQVGTNGEVDGNYGFGDLTTGDYLVEAVSPTDEAFAALNGTTPKPIYTFTDETAINVFTGDTYIPQGDYTTNGESAGPATTLPASGYPENTSDSACAGRSHTIHVTAANNPDFFDNGGTPAENQVRPYCNIKLVRVQPRRSVAPIFHVFTPVPIPTRFVGYIIDDLNVSTDPKSIVFGEKAGMANVPVGIYDFTGRLVYTAESDYNGYYEALLPSTDTIACPTPSGVCPNVYRLVGNDPGQLSHPNLNYNPQYRTIGTEFQGWPGVIHPVDQAPSRVAASFQLPGSQVTTPPVCAVPATQPEFYRINKPYGGRGFKGYTITGTNFGTAEGSLILGTASIPVKTWSNESITFDIPTNATPGAATLRVQSANGEEATNGITFHVLGTQGNNVYNPRILEVGTGKQFDPANDPAENVAGPRAIQQALDAARASGNNTNTIVVVYPNEAARYANFNPNRAYFENVVIHSRVKLQGVGPGGPTPETAGARIDGRYFWSVAADGNAVYADNWLATTEALPAAGNRTVASGQVIYVRPETNGQFSNNNNPFNTSIDGFTITGGDQQGFPGNLNFLGGGPNGTPRAGANNVETQGGGVFVNSRATNTQISNNVFVSNGGTFGGAIRVGTPELGTTQATSDNNNDNVKILRNRIVANGGTMFAGAIGVFYGSDNYEIGNNDICGNASAEYGGGISVYGRSPNGHIHHNRIINNQAYDEAGGIMIAGELPANVLALSTGSGTVQIDHNTIEANLSNDDGGGIRFLMAAGNNNDLMNVNDNIVANNVATHEGGGIAIDDTPNVRIVNNTIVKNITTATAMTSNGKPAPAGVSTGSNSALLQARLNRIFGNNSSPKFSNPFLVNNIFADNRAGTWTVNGVIGIGATGDSTLPLRWDVGTSDASGTPTVYGSLMDSTASTVAIPKPPAFKGGTSYKIGAGSFDIQDGGTSGISKIGFVQAFDIQVAIVNWRTFPNFQPASIVTITHPIAQVANYHLAAPRPSTEIVVDQGVPSVPATPYSGSVVAPGSDIDDGIRTATPDIGADELAAVKPGPPALLTSPSSLLDAFNRITSNSLGSNWSGNGYRINAPTLPTGVAFGFSSGIQTWNGTNSNFGANQFAEFTVKALPNLATTSFGLVLKSNGSVGSQRFIEVRYNQPGNIVVGYSTAGLAPANFHPVGDPIPIALAINQTLSAQVDATGTVEVFRNGTSIGSRTLPVTLTGWSNANNTNGGRIGIRYIAANASTTSTVMTKVDDFGGGSL